MNNNASSAHLSIPDDDDVIATALQDASIPTLMMSMIHMSGDASLLDGDTRPGGAYINEYQGYMSEEDKAAIRAQALSVIKNFRDRGCQLPSAPDRATIHRMMNFLVAQEVPQDYLPMMPEEMELGGRVQRSDARGEHVRCVEAPRAGPPTPERARGRACCHAPRAARAVRSPGGGKWKCGWHGVEVTAIRVPTLGVGAQSNPSKKRT